MPLPSISKLDAFLAILISPMTACHSSSIGFSGENTIQVIHASEASVSEVYAAEELARYLTEMTGESVTIGTVPRENCIVVAERSS